LQATAARGGASDGKLARRQLRTGPPERTHLRGEHDQRNGTHGHTAPDVNREGSTCAVATHTQGPEGGEGDEGHRGGGEHTTREEMADRWTHGHGGGRGRALSRCRFGWYWLSPS
jgi:hypothetical protein